MCNPISLYLRYPLRWTMMFIENNHKPIMILIYISIVASAIYIIYLFTHSSTREQDYGTMQTIEHAPITTPLLLVCTHIVLAFFAHKLYKIFEAGKMPVSPSVFAFLIGKVFMGPRLIMAYF